MLVTKKIKPSNIYFSDSMFVMSKWFINQISWQNHITFQITHLHSPFKINILWEPHIVATLLYICQIMVRIYVYNKKNTALVCLHRWKWYNKLLIISFVLTTYIPISVCVTFSTRVWIAGHICFSNFVKKKKEKRKSHSTFHHHIWSQHAKCHTNKCNIKFSGSQRVSCMIFSQIWLCVVKTVFSIQALFA